MSDTGDYIPREAAIDSLLGWAAQLTKTYGKNDEYVKCLESAAYNIEQLPAADVRPVVRGKWKRVVDFTGVEAFGYKETTLVGYGCNVCGYEVDVSEGDYNFCPNCGADMREEQT